MTIHQRSSCPIRPNSLGYRITTAEGRATALGEYKLPLFTFFFCAPLLGERQALWLGAASGPATHRHPW
jgi:hypothetical protein